MQNLYARNVLPNTHTRRPAKVHEVLSHRGRGGEPAVGIESVGALVNQGKGEDAVDLRERVVEDAGIALECIGLCADFCAGR